MIRLQARQAKYLRKRHGVTVIPGIEISAFDYDRNQKYISYAIIAVIPIVWKGLCKN